MQVNFFATFRTIVGKKTVFFDLADNTTVAQLLQVIVDTYPELSSRLQATGEQLSPHIQI